MRELALVTLRIVDEFTILSPEDVDRLYTPDTTDTHNAVDSMDRVEADTGVLNADCVEGGITFKPKSELTTIRIEACNLASALAAAIEDDERHFIRQNIIKLGIAGLRLLNFENDNRRSLNKMSRALGGDGLGMTDMVQFYAVFDLSTSESGVEASLEGVLRLDKIDFAIDEAIML